jgi:hypothetical protein
MGLFGSRCEIGISAAPQRLGSFGAVSIRIVDMCGPPIHNGFVELNRFAVGMGCIYSFFVSPLFLSNLNYGPF